MTTQKLLRNLNKKVITIKMCYRYQVTKRIKCETGSDYAYVMVFNQMEFPIYLLKYRLDLSYLVDFYEIGGIRMHSSDLKAFEEIS